jgi:CubicO group peptidase (beta-lactamase class C family)
MLRTFPLLKKLRSKAYGKADYHKDLNCTPDTKFLIGSLTKQFTALLVLQQVQHGTLRLDQTIESFCHSGKG